MRSTILRFIQASVLLLLGCWLQTASAALPGGISGHWYNPEQSGHGLTVLLVQPDFAQAVWHVYDPNGNPLTLVIEGEVSGHGIHGTAYAPRGMRFGNLDPADKEVSVWGEVGIDFLSCSRAELSWDANDPAYGEGSMPLHRLAGIVGADCVLPPIETAEFGRYTGQILPDPEPWNSEPSFNGVLDMDGRLWGVERLRFPLLSPMPSSAPLAHRTIVTQALKADNQIRGRASQARWTRSYVDPQNWDLSGQWFEEQPGAEMSWRTGEGEQTLTIAPAEDDRSLVAPIDAEGLAGRWEVPVRDQLFESRVWLSIDPDGHACIDMFPYYEPRGGCHFEGWIDGVEDGGVGLLDFVINRPEVEDYPIDSYSGRGWVTTGPGGRELILVGNDGFMLMAYPEP